MVRRDGLGAGVCMMMVLVADGDFAYLRKDGVIVCPIGCLLVEMSADLWTMRNVANIQCCQCQFPIPIRVSDVGNYEEGTEAGLCKFYLASKICMSIYIDRLA